MNRAPDGAGPAADPQGSKLVVLKKYPSFPNKNKNYSADQEYQLAALRLGLRRRA